MVSLIDGYVQADFESCSSVFIVYFEQANTRLNIAEN